jgi:hypothetical protein
MEWFTLLSARFPPPPHTQTYWMGGWVGPTGGLDDMEK